jgi:hypothetical protein
MGGLKSSSRVNVPLSQLSKTTELLPLDASASGSGDIIEAQVPAQHFRELGLGEGETVVLTPRRAKVFVAS